MKEKKRYIIKHYSQQPGEKFFTNDLEEAVHIAIEKAKNTKHSFAIYDNKNKEIAGIVKPNGEIERDADSVLGKSQNQAVNSGTLRIDKEALREMIRDAVAKKLGIIEEAKKKDPKSDHDNRNTHDKVGKLRKDADQRDKEKKDLKKGDLHETPGSHKITKSQLKEAVARATRMALIQEAANSLGIGPYSTKVDKLVSESIDSIDKLVEEGEDLMKENPTHDYAVQERNHMVQARIGILKGLKSQLVRIMEDLYRKV